MTHTETPDDLVEPFRLAFRHEGSAVNCYVAPVDTMEGARLISTMPTAVLDADKSIWEDWKKLMRRALVVMCREALGFEPVSMKEQPAPETERGGNA